MPINLFLPQVTRIPVVGPAPFNTLVCVSAGNSGGPVNRDRGKLSRWTWTVPTPFKLVGFDQRMPPNFQHSTTAWLSEIGPYEDDNWITAVDSVIGAGFDPSDGTFFINIAMAARPGSTPDSQCEVNDDGSRTCIFDDLIQVTSFVLCYEPPLASPPAKAERVSPIAPPRPGTLAERRAQQYGVPYTVGGESRRGGRRSKGTSACACRVVAPPSSD